LRIAYPGRRRETGQNMDCSAPERYKKQNYEALPEEADVVI